MFCLLPMRLPPESGRFQIDGLLVAVDGPQLDLAGGALGGDIQKDEIVPDDGRRAAEGRQRQLPRDVLGRAPVVGNPVSVLTPSSEVHATAASYPR